MRISGRSFWRNARFVILPVIAIAGFTAWIMLPELSDAEGQSARVPSAVTTGALQNVTWVDPAQAAPPTDATAASAAPAPHETASRSSPAHGNPLIPVRTIATRTVRPGG